MVVHKREGTECNTSGRTSCQFLSGRFLDFKLIVPVTPLHIMPLHLCLNISQFQPPHLSPCCVVIEVSMECSEKRKWNKSPWVPKFEQ